MPISEIDDDASECNGWTKKMLEAKGAKKMTKKDMHEIIAILHKYDGKILTAYNLQFDIMTLLNDCRPLQLVKVFTRAIGNTVHMCSQLLANKLGFMCSSYKSLLEDKLKKMDIKDSILKSRRWHQSDYDCQAASVAF